MSRTTGVSRKASRRRFGWLAATGAAAVFMLSGTAMAVPGPGDASGDREKVDLPGSEGSQQRVTESQFDGLSFNFSNLFTNFGRGGGGGSQTSMRPGTGGFAAGTGLGAGNGSLANGVWANFSVNRVSDDTKGLTTEGNTYTGVIGYDRLFMDDKLLVGLGVIIDNSDFSTLYNAGSIDATSYGVVPYAAYRVTDELSVNLLFNYSLGSADSFRLTPGGANVSGEYDFDRWFVQGGLDYEITRGNWAFIAGTSLSYGEEGSDGYTESNGNRVADQTNVLGTWRIGGQVGYTFTLDEQGGGFAEPYVTFGYEIDFERTKIKAPTGVAPHANDNDQFNLGAGVNVYVGDNWSANFEGTGGLGREDVGNWSLSGTLRYQF